MADKFVYTLPSLEKIAEGYKQQALTYVYKGYAGWKKAPYKTGNLFRQVDDYNAVRNMATYRPSRHKTKYELPSITVSLNYSPPAADYGRYVHDGTYKMEARPFAKLAAEGPEFKKAVDEAILGKDGILNAYIKQVGNEFDGVLRRISRSK